MITRIIFTHYARPVLATRFGRERATDIMNQTFSRYETPLTAPQQRGLGGRLMVYCAALTAALYRVLLDHGLSEPEARAEAARVTGSIYTKMAAIPWLVARMSTRSPIGRLRKATDAFRHFPFGKPAYMMKDIDSDQATVAFDVKRCPVAEYFRAEGLPELCVETFCNLDFPLAETWGARLERKTTLAGGADHCDFRWRLKSSSVETNR